MAPFKDYLETGKDPKPGLWRTFVGLLLIFAGLLITTMIGTVLGYLLMPLVFGIDSSALELQDLLGQSEMLLLSAVIGIALMHPVMALIVRFLHGRPYRTLLGAAERLNRRNLTVGMLAALGATALATPLSVFLGLVEITPQELAPNWWLGAVIIAFLIVFQASAEEVIFRGYLVQGFGNAAPRGWSGALLWALLPALLFTAIHLNGNFDQHGQMHLLAVFAFALFAAALVYVTGGLSAAIGYHIMNNWLALIVFRSELGIEGMGAFEVRFGDNALGMMMAVECLSLLVLFFVMRRFVRPE
ncbi:MAG: CPBP family glutamic-type intramembrane protease [Neomegalonema sp.]|nr:CPBP family glutamic-type intramembrane protease [Neomegalonema sp.]